MEAIEYIFEYAQAYVVLGLGLMALVFVLEGAARLGKKLRKKRRSK